MPQNNRFTFRAAFERETLDNLRRRLPADSNVGYWAAFEINDGELTLLNTKSKGGENLQKHRQLGDTSSVVYTYLDLARDGKFRPGHTISFGDDVQIPDPPFKVDLANPDDTLQAVEDFEAQYPQTVSAFLGYDQMDHTDEMQDVSDEELLALMGGTTANDSAINDDSNDDDETGSVQAVDDFLNSNDDDNDDDDDRGSVQGVDDFLNSTDDDNDADDSDADNNNDDGSGTGSTVSIDGVSYDGMGNRTRIDNSFDNGMRTRGRYDPDHEIQEPFDFVEDKAHKYYTYKSPSSREYTFYSRDQVRIMSFQNQLRRAKFEDLVKHLNKLRTRPSHLKNIMRAWYKARDRFAIQVIDKDSGRAGVFREPLHTIPHLLLALRKNKEWRFLDYQLQKRRKEYIEWNQQNVNFVDEEDVVENPKTRQAHFNSIIVQTLRDAFELTPLVLYRSSIFEEPPPAGRPYGDLRARVGVFVHKRRVRKNQIICFYPGDVRRAARSSRAAKSKHHMCVLSDLNVQGAPQTCIIPKRGLARVCAGARINSPPPQTEPNCEFLGPRYTRILLDENKLLVPSWSGQFEQVAAKYHAIVATRNIDVGEELFAYFPAEDLLTASDEGASYPQVKYPVQHTTVRAIKNTALQQLARQVYEELTEGDIDALTM